MLFADYVVLLVLSGGDLQLSLEQVGMIVSEGRIEWEIGRWIGAASAVVWSLYRSVVVKRESNQKAGLSVDWSVFAPTLTYDH